MEQSETFVKIYSQKYYPEQDFKYEWSKGYYPKHTYYVQNNYKRKMILLVYFNYLPDDLNLYSLYGEYYNLLTWI